MSAPIYRGGRPYIKPGIRFGNNTGIFNGTAAPVNGTSGTLVNVAGPGSIYQRTNGSVYVNTNTKASPTWVSLGVGAASAALTTPTITGGTITGATLASSILTDDKSLVLSATASANITPATLTGFSWTVVAGATYHFELDLATTLTTVGGLALSFLLTTTTLTSIRYNTLQFTASVPAYATGTTAASGTKIIDNKTAAYIGAKVTGSMVINAGGTFEWQFCQNTSAGAGDASIILLGSTAKMRRVL